MSTSTFWPTFTNPILRRYKTDPEIEAMTNLVEAYQRREVHSAERILRGRFIEEQYSFESC